MGNPVTKYWTIDKATLNKLQMLKRFVDDAFKFRDYNTNDLNDVETEIDI